MEITQAGTAAVADEDLVASEYLTFTLGSEEYAIDILKVQEIRGYEPPTLIANAPPFIKGVINLRGIIVPIVDLRIKFNLAQVEYTPFTVVIILNVANRVIGAVVDSVSDVISMTPQQVRPAPDFSASFDTKYILGLATVENRMLIVIDIAQLMTSRDMELMDAAD
ncbi:MAG TPA: chemotaxis protein CheW [Rhodocyclaceae bacterium]|jgi:purine-binding chemotaxis protein CheW|nr:chemotaxis protein CheW [Betaproteobacteria bacterium]HMU99826.1 chemotaxis protein CheW [Rhodocyclaceae bacterium]HNN42180.1 chemotaxis protein CheW [Nitrospira sp.]HMV22408.1 chemotaxis protein CheW [Rhodocyclaceae bacterium]HNE43456.1 chemotaxis protein CheW [Rhodocyclaceae bacterium]